MVTQANLIEEARLLGVTLSKPVIVRWHRAGILPRPSQLSLGRAGSVACYPDEATDIVRAACRHYPKVRNLSRLAWELWWDRAPAPMQLVRACISTLAAGFDAEVREVRKERGQMIESETPEGAWLDFLEHSSQARLPADGLGRVRRRLGSAVFPQFIDVSAAVIAGQYDPDHGLVSEETDSAVMLRGLGALNTDVDGDQLPNLASHEDLVDVSSLLGAAKVGELMSSATDEELGQARDFMLVILRSPVLPASLASLTNNILAGGRNGPGRFAALAIVIACSRRDGIPIQTLSELAIESGRVS